jgi:hypothetical protein
VNIIAGSLTTFTEMNPSFVVIEVDEETLLPLNVETYYFNITHANLYNDPQWLLLHDFTGYYGIPDFSPDSLASFADRILNNETLANLYEWNKSRQVGQMPLTCDS